MTKIEMFYTPKNIVPFVLNNGIYKGHRFAVVNLGTYPVAYVQCKLDGLSNFEDERLCGISVHGGLTYVGDNYWTLTGDNSCYIGWDYNHAQDWKGEYTIEENRGLELQPHTTDEITQDCYNVIEQLLNI